MHNTLHYLLMADHTTMKKQFFSRIRQSGLTSGQPKVLDYLYRHDGAIQKDIAIGCYIEPASLSNILCGMEKMGLIERKTGADSRRTTNVYLTKKGTDMARTVQQEFAAEEAIALEGFSKEETAEFLQYLKRIKINMEAEHDVL